MIDKKSINELKKSLINELKSVNSESQLEQFRLQHLSRQGSIAQLFVTLKNAHTDIKRIIGPELNKLKQEIFELFEKQQQKLLQESFKKNQQKEQNFDVTINRPGHKGTLHPYTLAIEQIQNIFTSMGFTVAQGPELETEFFNFTALNIPQNHPARSEMDTFWIDDTQLLRTHTSTAQIRTMLKQKPPIAIIAPGRAMRNEATDASHDFMFMQLEGLYVAENVSIANLLATLKSFLTAFFGHDIKLRIRPGYFPFVEPGFEIDASCPFCKKGCSVCKKTKWIELLPAGLVHPKVLKACKLDPKKYSGFAFGCGLTRLVMLKYQIPDIRLLHSGNMDFLKQF